jgi:hypothetical protein
MAAVATAPTMRKPIAPDTWIATATNAPSAQASWNRVSNTANARPRLAPGASRCTMLSKFSRPSAAIRFSTPASTTAPNGPPSTATVRPAASGTSSAIVSIVSSRTRSRSSFDAGVAHHRCQRRHPDHRANHSVP